jgi:hypothetical protein
MSLGIAAVVIFVLYLIDKNQQWEAAAKVAAVLVVLTEAIGANPGDGPEASMTEEKPSKPDSFKLITDECGQTTISAFPAFKFSCRRDAELFWMRVTQSRQSGLQGMPSPLSRKSR